MSSLIIPIFILLVFFIAFFKKINAYESFIKGASFGLEVLVKILPVLMAMIFTTEVIKASGIIEFIFNDFQFFLPSEIIMQGLFRPLSGNASLGVMVDIYEKFGVDSREALYSSILQGSSDTTIYVMTVYFGSVGVKKYRYALLLGIISDILCFFITIMLLYFIFRL